MKHNSNLFKVAVFPLIIYAQLSMAADPLQDFGERALQEELRQREQQRLQKQTPSIQIEEGTAPEIKDEGPCFQIDRIEIAGNTILSEKSVIEITSSFTDTCMTREAINVLIYKLTRAYIDDGYITARVYLPQQDLTSGRLELVIVEGFIERIDINNNTASDRRKLWWAMPAREDRILQLRELEQGVDQLNRVPSANASLKLWPGERPGGTRIEIENRPRDAIRGQLAIDNNGSESTGKQRIRIGTEMDNLLNINDAWTMFYIGSEDTNALAFNMAFPFRDWSFSYVYSYSEYLSILTPTTDLFGQSDSNTLSAEYLVHRDGISQTRASFDLGRRRSKRFIVDIALQPQRLTPARLAIAHSARKKSSFWNVEFGYAKGLDALDADEDEDNLPADVPRAQFSKIDGYLYYSRSLVHRMQYSLTMLGQISRDTLYSSEQIHIGDYSTVRGFRDTPLSGDKGFFLRQEISWPSFYQPGNAEAGFWASALSRSSPFIALDYGRVDDNLPSTESARSLTGASMGLRYRGRVVNAEVCWARGVRADPDELKDENQFYFNVNLKGF